MLTELPDCLKHVVQWHDTTLDACSSVSLT